MSAIAAGIICELGREEGQVTNSFSREILEQLPEGEGVLGVYCEAVVFSLQRRGMRTG